MTYMRSVRNERGMALALTLFALVIIGVLVAGSFFIGRTEQQTGSNVIWAGQAQEAAEAGIAEVMATWDPIAYNAMVPGTELAFPTTQLDAGGSPLVIYTDTLQRINDQLFLIRSTGERRTPGGQVLATTRLGQFVRLAKPTFAVNAAVTVSDPIKLNGNSFLVSGINKVPPQWGAGECTPLDINNTDGNTDDVVGIRSATTTGITGKDLDNVDGFPAKEAANDPTITSATFQNFLDFTFNTLSSQPGVKVLPDVTPYNGVGPVPDTGTPPACDRSKLLNFGEPFRNPPTATAVTVCQGYFPIVHGTGAQTKFAAGSRGQGVLLIDGDLEIAGGFEWVGLIIVRGQMKINGTGNKIVGGILTEGVDLNTSGSISGNVEIHYSSCAIEKAVGGASVGQPLRRGWSQLL